MTGLSYQAVKSSQLLSCSLVSQNVKLMKKKKLFFFPAAGVSVEIAKVYESADTEDLQLGTAVDNSFPE